MKKLARRLGSSMPVAIFVSVFFFNLITSGREPAWGDARGMWDVANRMFGAQSIDINTRWPEDIPPGRNGKYYGIAPIGPSLVHLPGVAVSQAAHGIDPRYDGLARPLATHIAPAALGALACVLLFLLLRDLGIRVRTASLCAAILACSTTTWVYARMPYSEIVQLACFLGLFRQVLRTAADPSRREALWFGAWAGMLLNSKYVFAAAILGSAAVIAWALRHRRQELVRCVGWAAVTGVPLLALALVYNYARWGSITRTGYEPYLDAYFGGSVFDGAWGMLLSPNKSAFLYSPPLVLAMIGMPAAIRSVPRLGLALALMVLPVFLVYCTYRSWSGEYAWGPRFLVWAVPVLLIPLAWVIDAADARWRKAVVGGVVAIGVVVQLLGAALYWDHFIRISIDAKNQWLGQPNRRGSYVAEKGRGHCDSCFEDTYQMLWLPAFQPIHGHWWLLESVARGDTWQQATDEAPWRRYTSQQINLAQNYPRVRIDWWGLLWIKDFDQPHVHPDVKRGVRRMGTLLLVFFATGLAAGIWRWIRLHRAARGDSPGDS